MDYIKVFDKALSNELCDKLIDFFDSNPELQFQGSMGKDSKIDLSYKNSKEVYINKELHHEVIHSLFKKMEEYLKDFPHMMMDYKDEPWRIKKYMSGKGHYNWHVDASNKDYAQRVLAIIFYLNDVEEGGDTSIKLDGKIINTSPKKGRLLIFPANICYLHKGNIPISDNKYILVSFLRYS